MWHYLNPLVWSRWIYSPLMLRAQLKENDIKDFIIRENKAYTEDNVLIYNIFVYSIPKQLTEDNIQHYFSKFGKVLDVKFIEGKNGSRGAVPNVGFVNFAEPESACSVLQKNYHRSLGMRIGVNAAHSWNQPNADKACSLKTHDVASTSKSLSIGATPTNGGMHMLSLNDDCLETIFGYLNLKEQVRMARTCERFQDVFQMLCKRKFKNCELSTISEMTLWEQRDFFRSAGGNMTTITGTVPYKNREKILEFIRIFCTKLKSIRLDKSEMRNKCLKKFLLGYPQLQELTLRNCFLNDNSIKAMTHLSCLETLDLAENYKLTGKFISKLAQLKVLNINGCWNIRTSHLMDICKSLPNLRSLDTRGCEWLSDIIFDVMVEHCKELETLKLFCNELAFEGVALLPRLKQLELLCYYDGAQKILLAGLVAHKADQLEVLKFVSRNRLNAEHIALISELRQLKTLSVANNQLVNDDALNMFCKLQQLEDLTIKGCSNITNQGLLKLVKSCQRLHHLDIQLCNQITVEFLLETIKFLKASGKRKKPLVLIAYGTSICYHGATAYKEYKEAEEQSLISLIFHDSSVDLD